MGKFEGSNDLALVIGECLEVRTLGNKGYISTIQPHSLTEGKSINISVLYHMPMAVGASYIIQGSIDSLIEDRVSYIVVTPTSVTKINPSDLDEYEVKNSTDIAKVCNSIHVVDAVISSVNETSFGFLVDIEKIYLNPKITRHLYARCVLKNKYANGYVPQEGERISFIGTFQSDRTEYKVPNHKKVNIKILTVNPTSSFVKEVQLIPLTEYAKVKGTDLK